MLFSHVADSHWFPFIPCGNEWKPVAYFRLQVAVVQTMSLRFSNLDARCHCSRQPLLLRKWMAAWSNRQAYSQMCKTQQRDLQNSYCLCKMMWWISIPYRIKWKTEAVWSGFHLHGLSRNEYVQVGFNKTDTHSDYILRTNCSGRHRFLSMLHNPCMLTRLKSVLHCLIMQLCQKLRLVGVLKYKHITKA